VGISRIIDGGTLSTLPQINQSDAFLFIVREVYLARSLPSSVLGIRPPWGMKWMVFRVDHVKGLICGS
jgi:hypothetical protein